MLYWAMTDPKIWVDSVPRAKPPVDTALAACDLSLIRNYERHGYAQLPHRAPFLAQFRQGKKQLSYIAAAHELGPENETFATIDDAIERGKPQLLILEGFETSSGESPQFIQDEALKAADKHFKKSGECLYSAYHAMAANIPFMGGEAPTTAVFEHMASLGYTAKDVMAFYLLRITPQWRKEGLVNANNFDEYAARYLKKSQEFSHIPAEEHLSVEEFKNWYAKHNSTGLDYLSIDAQKMSPVHAPDASYFERMQADVSIPREAHLDRTIADALTKYDRVMVVYGNGHYVQSAPVLEHMFGAAPHYIKDGKLASHTAQLAQAVDGPLQVASPG